MSKTSKPDDFIIKLAKQTDSNSKDIKLILENLASINSLLEAQKTPPIEPPKLEVPAPVQTPIVQTDVFNIQASFNHQVTSADKTRVQQIGQVLSKTLAEMGVKDFKMTFKK